MTARLDRRAAAAGVAAVAALLVALACALALYPCLRVGSALLGHEPPPAEVLVPGPSGYVSRALASLFLGGLAGFPAFLVARRRPAFALAVARATFAVGGVLLGLQAAFMP